MMGGELVVVMARIEGVRQITGQHWVLDVLMNLLAFGLALTVGVSVRGKGRNLLALGGSS